MKLLLKDIGTFLCLLGTFACIILFFLALWAMAPVP